MTSVLPAEEKPLLSESVVKFIREHIHSVEQLEVLLLLQRHADREWTAEDVNYLLKSTEGSVSERLDDLHARKLIVGREESDKRYFTFSVDTSVKFSVEELGHYYKIFAGRVIETIFLKES